MIITLATQKGGVGKSTIAMNLAMGFASLLKKHKVALVDADYQESCMQIMQGHKFKNLDVIAAPEEPHKTIQKLKGYTAIFVDTPPDLDATMYQACAVSDIVVMPVQPSPLDLKATFKTVEVLQRIKEKGNLKYKCFFLINRASKGTVLANQMRPFIEKNYPFPALKTVLHNREVYKQSLIEGMSVVDFDKGSDATKEVAELIKELNRIINGINN